MAAITPELDQAMMKVWELKAPPLVKWGQALDLLGQAGFCYETPLHTDMVLCHPENRGGLGLNARNAHLVALKIKQRGADMAELNKATAFELANDDEVCSRIISSITLKRYIEHQFTQRKVFSKR